MNLKKFHLYIVMWCYLCAAFRQLGILKSCWVLCAAYRMQLAVRYYTDACCVLSGIRVACCVLRAARYPSCMLRGVSQGIRAACCEPPGIYMFRDASRSVLRAASHLCCVLRAASLSPLRAACRQVSPLYKMASSRNCTKDPAAPNDWRHFQLLTVTSQHPLHLPAYPHLPTSRNPSPLHLAYPLVFSSFCLALTYPLTTRPTPFLYNIQPIVISLPLYLQPGQLLSSPPTTWPTLTFRPTTYIKSPPYLSTNNLVSSLPLHLPPGLPIPLNLQPIVISLPLHLPPGQLLTSPPTTRSTHYLSTYHLAYPYLSTYSHLLTSPPTTWPTHTSLPTSHLLTSPPTTWSTPYLQYKRHQKLTDQCTISLPHQLTNYDPWFTNSAPFFFINHKHVASKSQRSNWLQGFICIVSIHGCIEIMLI